METTKTHGAAADAFAADAESDRAKDDRAEDDTATPAPTAPRPAPEAGPAAVEEPRALGEDALDPLDESDHVGESESHEVADAPADPRPAGVLAGAAAVVGAALGLASLTGTWLGTVLAERRQLIGQIEASSGSAAQQIEQIYGAPWHTTAVVNGGCALVALVVLGAVLLAARNAAPWVRAVAWGGIALGVLGLFIAGGMWFDLFGGLPSVAEPPVSSGG